MPLPAGSSGNLSAQPGGTRRWWWAWASRGGDGHAATRRRQRPSNAASFQALPVPAQSARIQLGAPVQLLNRANRAGAGLNPRILMAVMA